MKLNSSQTRHVFWRRCYSILSITQLKIDVFCYSRTSGTSIDCKLHRMMRVKTSLRFTVNIPGDFDGQGLNFLIKYFIKPFTLRHCHHIFPVSNGAWGKKQQRGVRSRTCTCLKACLLTASAILTKLFLASSASLSCWPPGRDSVCSLEDWLPSLGDVNIAQHIVLSPHNVTQLTGCVF